MGISHLIRKLPRSRKRQGVACALAALAVVGVTSTAPAGQMATYKVVNNEEITESLAGKPGDPAKGYEVAINRKLGNCLACHVMPAPEQPFHGAVGPDLTGVGGRLSEGRLRLQVVNAKHFNPDTIMPAFYKADGFNRVMKKFEGKSVLTAEQVEDVVAYLTTLK